MIKLHVKVILLCGNNNSICYYDHLLTAFCVKVLKWDCRSYHCLWLLKRLLKISFRLTSIGREDIPNIDNWEG